jgi:hypothetical protein
LQRFNKQFPIIFGAALHAELAVVALAAPQHAHAERLQVELLIIMLYRKAFVKTAIGRAVVVGICDPGVISGLVAKPDSATRDGFALAICDGSEAVAVDPTKPAFDLWISLA